MAPGADNEGFDAKMDGLSGDGVENVIIVGAGPAGLMLG
jgi:ribulose 1,5-bisphosphate synthetase/thiazole synthase